MQLMLQCNFRIVKLDVEYATDKFGRQTNFFQVEEFQISLCGQLTQIVVQIYNKYLRTDLTCYYQRETLMMSMLR